MNEAQASYRLANPASCPFCMRGSSMTATGAYDEIFRDNMRGKQVRQEHQCPHCKQEWWDVLKPINAITLD